MNEKCNLSYDVGESIIRWCKDGGDFPIQKVEQALAFCKGDVEHRKIAVKHLAIHCLHSCDKQEMQAIDSKLKDIAENPSVTQVKRTLKRKF